jgi:hypothetical protein
MSTIPPHRAHTPHRPNLRMKSRRIFLYLVELRGWPAGWRRVIRASKGLGNRAGEKSLAAETEGTQRRIARLTYCREGDHSTFTLELPGAKPVPRKDNQPVR